jgi:hypothetical protein
MPRLLALAVVVSLAAAPAAAANPSISVTATRDGSLRALPATVVHELALTAGADPETVEVGVFPFAQIDVSGPVEALRVPESGVGPSVATCPGRWSHFHAAYADGPSFDDVSFTIPPGATVELSARVQLIGAPWAGETLDATWTIDPLFGRTFDVVSNAGGRAVYSGPAGVELDFQARRTAGDGYVVAGTAEPDVSGGRVELWAYPPRRGRAARLARTRVRDGHWAVTGWRPDRRGRWELYARYRPAGTAHASDASQCGTFVRVP